MIQLIASKNYFRPSLDSFPPNPDPGFPPLISECAPDSIFSIRHVVLKWDFKIYFFNAIKLSDPVNHNLYKIICKSLLENTNLSFFMLCYLHPPTLFVIGPIHKIRFPILNIYTYPSRGTTGGGVNYFTSNLKKGRMKQNY